MATHPNAALIERFYSSFTRRDAAGMNVCYHADAEFTDDAFGTLNASEVRTMWAMLCERATDLRVEYRDIKANDETGSAHWEAWYTFAATGRPVHNVLEARFEFEDGLIRRHIDSFSFGRWAGQALGLPGKLLGRTPFFKKAFRRRARALLDEYRRKA
jgi:ketosteroid isomerase-like protein